MSCDCALHVPDGHHRRQHGVVLVVVLVHAVAADRVQVRNRIDERSDDVEMSAVRRVVDGIRLRHPDDAAIHDIPLLCETKGLELPARLIDQIRVLALPEAVALEAEVLEPEACRARRRHHRRAPVVEVLNAADLDPGSVNVDPVVREQLVLLQHERDSQKVAIPQAFGRFVDRRGHAGGHRTHQAANRHRRDEVLGLERPIAGRGLGGHRRDAAVPDVKAVDVVVEQHLMAALDDAIAAQLPHLARDRDAGTGIRGSAS